MNTQDLRKERASTFTALDDDHGARLSQGVGGGGLGAWVCGSSQGVLPTGKRWSALCSRIAGNQGDAVPHCAGGWLQGWQVEARGRRLRQP